MERPSLTGSRQGLAELGRLGTSGRLKEKAGNEPPAFLVLGLHRRRPCQRLYVEQEVGPVDVNPRDEVFVECGSHLNEPSRRIADLRVGEVPKIYVFDG